MKNNWVMTRTGKHFTPFNPKIEDIDIEDIAHALSNICRFRGHCSEFYSVAEHSVLVSVLCPEGLKLKGLLHDAAEAYLGDVPTPLKDTKMEKAEEKLQEAIFNKFGVRVFEGHYAIKRIDEQALFWEADKLGMFPLSWDWVPNGLGEFYPELIQCLSPAMAKRLFLAHFNSLTK